MRLYPSTVLRPVTQEDLPRLLKLAESAGPGMTNLPFDEQALQNKIEISLNSFENGRHDTEFLGYLFVLDDLSSKQIVGCSGIATAGSSLLPFYHFKLSEVRYVSEEVELAKTHKTLTMVNDYQGCSEICSLYLLPEYRKDHNGSLLSRLRFLFMADHKTRFNETIIAEMRGFVNKDGTQPFWDGVMSKFIDMPFFKADKLTGMGIKKFIPELMPRYPLYVETLPLESQQVINKVHTETKPALKMLEFEGFESHGYVDIFDAGPMVECKLNKIRTVRKSIKACVSSVVDSKKITSNNKYLVSNARLDFRGCLAEIDIQQDDNEQIIISKEVADILELSAGDHIRYVVLKDHK